MEFEREGEGGEREGETINLEGNDGVKHGEMLTSHRNRKARRYLKG